MTLNLRKIARLGFTLIGLMIAGDGKKVEAEWI
jgi:hypothetical protein